MAYTEEKFTSKDKRIIIQKKFHTLFVMPTNPKVKQRRLPQSKETEDRQKKINERLRRDKYTRLLADNFVGGDYYLTLTTEKKLTPEELVREMSNFMRRLKREVVKRTGEKPKYFKVLENLLGSGRPHAHLLINKFAPAEEIRELMTRLWTAGRVKTEIYGGRAEDAWHVADYFSKQTRQEHGAKIDTSRGNLIRREPVKKIIHAETFRDDIKAPRGYAVVKKLSYNTFTAAGYPYQVAVFEKIERGKANAKTD